MEERQAQISIELRKRFPEGTADAGLMEEAVQELIASQARQSSSLQCRIRIARRASPGLARPDQTLPGP